MAGNIETIGGSSNATSSYDDTMAPRTNADAPAHAGHDWCAIAGSTTVVTITNPNAIWKFQKAPARNSLVGAVQRSLPIEQRRLKKKTTSTSSVEARNVVYVRNEAIAIPPEHENNGIG